jgi:hypothetical protein
VHEVGTGGDWQAEGDLVGSAAWFFSDSFFAKARSLGLAKLGLATKNGLLKS